MHSIRPPRKGERRALDGLVSDGEEQGGLSRESREATAGPRKLEIHNLFA